MTVPEFINEFKDIVLIKDFICLVGSSVEKKEYNDIDLLIRLSEPTDYLKRAIETRLSKLLPDKKLHFIWGDPEGPHDTFIPLYDLKLELLQPEIVKMGSAILMHPIKPMKPGRKFYSIKEVVEYCAKEEKTWAVEKKYNGFRVTIHKSGNDVKIFSEHGQDITEVLPTCVEMAKTMSINDFVIDAEMVAYDDKKPLGRSELAKYVTAPKSGKIVSDKCIRYHVFDCLYYDADITKKEWHERQKFLSKLKFNDVLMKVEPMIISGAHNLYKAVRLASNLIGSEGAVLKQYDSQYMIGQESSLWVKYRVLLPIKVIVLKVNKVDDVYNYTVGVIVTKQFLKKINAKYLFELNGKKYLLLGNTFNTSKKAEIGQILDLEIEEVWRHRHKDGTVHYSLHKPHVVDISSYKATDTIALLDEYVVSRGEEVSEESEKNEMGDSTNEISEIIAMKSEIKNFPNEMQKAFLRNQDWNSFVLQWHYRGHKITDNERKAYNIPDKFIYKLDSIHTDWRFKVNSHLEGFTLFTPGSAKESYEDKLTAELADVRATIKLSQPTGWLTFEGISEIGQAGATAESPAVFVIVGKGKYRTITAEDHRIIVELEAETGKVNLDIIEKAEASGIYIERKPPAELKALPKKVSFHIAHIGNKHIILVDKVK